MGCFYRTNGSTGFWLYIFCKHSFGIPVLQCFFGTAELSRTGTKATAQSDECCDPVANMSQNADIAEKEVDVSKPNSSVQF